MNKYSAVVAIGSLLCAAALPVNCNAENLEDAWSAALAADQRLAAAHAQNESAEFEVYAAQAERYPSIGLMTSFVQVDDAPRFAFGDTFVSPQLFGGNNLLSGGSQLSMPLYTSGRIQHEINSASSNLDASQYQVLAIAQDLKLRVAQNYIDVLRSGQALDVAESTATSLRAQTTDAKNKYDNGAVAHNDYLAASIALANAQQRVLVADNALEIARSTYNRKLGRSLTTAVNLDPALTAPGDSEQLNDLNTLIDSAIDNRPELQAYTAQSRAIRERAAAVRARVRPQLSMTGGYTYLENNVLDDEQFWWIGVGAVWNAFDSGRTRNRAAALERQATALDHEREDIKSMITLDVRRAWLDWHEAQQRIAVTATAIEQAQENLRVTRDRYIAGAGTNTEVLDAETLRALSLNNRNNAIYDTAFARMRLLRALGAL